MRPQTALKLLIWIFVLIGGGLLCAEAALLILHINLLPVNITLLSTGGVFALTGLLLFVTQGSQGRKKRRLMATGESVDAEIVDVEVNGNFSVNGRCPYRAVCKYSEGGVNYICRSGNLWDYPERRGNTVRVWRNPRNFRDYYVDLSDVLVETVEL